MLRSFLLLGVALATAAPARADDTSMFVSLGGTIGIGSTIDGEDALGRDYEPEGTLAARLTLSWEPAPLPYREPRGYRTGFAAVPEVTVGFLRIADRRTGDPDDNTDGFFTLGGRLELRLSQRRMGLLQVSARAGLYVAGRVGLLTDADRTPLVEIAVGEHFFVGDNLHVGGELGGTRYFGEDYAEVPLPTARTPWRDGNGQYMAFQGTLYVGWKL